MALDINAMAASAYNIIKNIQNSATEAVGIDCLWARAIPYVNSEDVILQEYTLSNVGVECPRPIKCIVQNTDYNPGNFTVDLFGLQYEAPLEISIPIDIWANAFDNESMPQKGDIVYIGFYHKLYEVTTSTIIYSIASMPTYYKCELGKYVPTASRKETEEFRESVEDITVTQQTLFGDAISNEVADIVNDVETSKYNTTTYVDPIKDCDLDSIVTEDVWGADANRISVAHYDFTNANCNIRYHVSQPYKADTHWIYSSWIRHCSDIVCSGKVISLNLYSRNNNVWRFTISASIPLNIGDTVTLTRGTMFKIVGVIVPLECSDGIGIEIEYKQIAKANKKMKDWWNGGAWKIYKTQTINLITAYNGEDMPFRVDLVGNLLDVRFGMFEKKIEIRDINLKYWNYVCIDFSIDSIRVIVNEAHRYADKVKDNLIFDGTFEINAKEFDTDSFEIQDMGTSLQISNIRIYENEYPIEETWAYDMYSPQTRNASKLVIVDQPNSPNKKAFISPVR